MIKLITIIIALTLPSSFNCLSFLSPAFTLLFQEIPSQNIVIEKSKASKIEKKSLERIDLSVRGNERFLSKLKLFRKSVYPFSKEIDFELNDILSDSSKRGPSLLLSYEHATEITIPSCYDYMDNFAGRLRVHKKIIDMGEDDNGVFIVIDRISGQKYIHKIFGKDREYDAEIGFFNSISHPNIVKPICLVSEKSGTRKGLIMEYIEGETSIKWAKRQSTTRTMLKEATVSLANILQFLHRRGYTHGGIKPENVMISHKDSKVILIDFGYTFHSSHGGSHIRPLYKMKAPEINNLLSNDPSEGSDFWSLGQLIGNWFSFKDIPGHRLIINLPDPISGKIIPRARGGGLYMVKILSKTNYEFEEFSLSAFPEDLRRLLALLMTPSPIYRSFLHEGTWAFLKEEAFFKEVKHLFND